MPSLYDLHSDPAVLYKHSEADRRIPHVFYPTYKDQPDELKERESAIAKSPYHSYEYAVNVLHDRFPPGEQAIATDLSYSYLYARDVIKGRWPPGEKVIATSAYHSYRYAKVVIKGPWPPGEKTIDADPIAHARYEAFLETIPEDWHGGARDIFDDYDN